MQAEALIAVRERMKPYLDLQLVAFPQGRLLPLRGRHRARAPRPRHGFDVVGGIPDYELTAELGNRSVRELCEMAAKRDLRVDMHTDQTLDPQSRQIEALTCETIRLGLGEMASGSHCTSITTFHDNYAMKLIEQIANARLNIVVSPMTSATCLKVMTRVEELWDAGVNIAFAQDCVMDPWYAFGKADMLEVAHMAIHFGRLLSKKRKAQVFDAITYGGARALGLEGYGLDRGCNADMVVLQAGDPMEAVRLGAPRLFVIRRARSSPGRPPGPLRCSWRTAPSTSTSGARASLRSREFRSAPSRELRPASSAPAPFHPECGRGAGDRREPPGRSGIAPLVVPPSVDGKAEGRDLVRLPLRPVHVRHPLEGPVLPLLQPVERVVLIDREHHAVLHHLLATDEDVAHRPRRSGVDQALERIADRPHRRVPQVDHGEVRLRPRRDAPEVVPAEGPGRTQGRGLEHVLRPQQVDVAARDLRHEARDPHLLDHVVRVAVGAEGHVDPRRPVAAEASHHVAPLRERARAVHHGRSRFREALEVAVLVVVDPRCWSMSIACPSRVSGPRTPISPSHSMGVLPWRRTISRCSMTDCAACV